MKTIDEIRGANGFAAAPAVLRQGPHAGGTADTDNLSASNKHVLGMMLFTQFL